MGNQPKGYYIFMAILGGILIPLSLLATLAYPPFIIVFIIAGICEYILLEKIADFSRYKKMEIEQGKILIRKGYRKICSYFYINEKTETVNIYSKNYKYSQIIDCELVQDNNNRIAHSNTLAVSAVVNYCRRLYINITVDDLKSPNITLNILSNGMSVRVNSNKYNMLMAEANNAMSTLKLIISKNK